MNQDLVPRQFEDFMTVYGFSNHGDFPKHIPGVSLIPDMTDLPEEVGTCHPLGMVGSSDHSTVLTTIKASIEHNEATARVNWLLSQGEWNRLKEKLDSIVGTELHDYVNTQVNSSTNLFLSIQNEYVPSQT